MRAYCFTNVNFGLSFFSRQIYPKLWENYELLVYKVKATLKISRSKVLSMQWAQAARRGKRSFIDEYYRHWDEYSDRFVPKERTKICPNNTYNSRVGVAIVAFRCRRKKNLPFPRHALEQCGAALPGLPQCRPYTLVFRSYEKWSNIWTSVTSGQASLFPQVKYCTGNITGKVALLTDASRSRT